MQKITRMIALAACTTLLAGSIQAQTASQIGAAPVVSTQGGSVQADYMTTADGCTYRRTQAPGYAPQWIVVLNPHHIGRPNSPRHCRSMRQ